MREAAAHAAKEAIESLPKAEMASLPGCGRREYGVRDSGDSRNGNRRRPDPDRRGDMRPMPGCQAVKVLRAHIAERLLEA